MIDAVLRSSAVLAAGFALLGMFASRSAAVRHGIVAAALFGAAAAVLLSFVPPLWTLTVPAITRPVVQPPPAGVTRSADRDTIPSAAISAAASTHLPVLPLLWAAGCAAALGIMAIGAVRIGRLTARARVITDERWVGPTRALAASYGIRRSIRLAEVDAGFVPATWGVRPAQVLLPARAREWSDERIHAVLSHELAHVARADWLVQMAAQAALAAIWFNPLAWLAAQALRREAELACDDIVLTQGVAPADYALHLVALARDCRRPAWTWMPALLMARPSTFERRIAAMLNPRLDRSPLARPAAAALTVVVLALTVATGTVRAVQGPAELSGTVYDSSGAVIPGVTLTLSEAREGTVSIANGAVTAGRMPASSQATTDNAGHFSLFNVAPGHYVLTASLPGFRQLHEEFDLKAAPDWNRAVTLQVGSLRETINVSATRTFAAPAASGPVRIRVGGSIRAPMKVHDVKPIYPESMRAEGREADVQLEATIDRDGSVSAVRVLSAQLHPDFAIAAVDAVRQWRFTPTLLNGKPIDVVMTVAMRFSLAD